MRVLRDDAVRCAACRLHHNDSLDGDPTGALTFAKGYAPAGPPGGEGRAIASCREGVLLVGAATPGDSTSWMIRTSAKGDVPLKAPGSTIDL